MLVVIIVAVVGGVVGSRKSNINHSATSTLPGNASSVSSIPSGSEQGAAATTSTSTILQGVGGLTQTPTLQGVGGPTPTPSSTQVTGKGTT